MPNATFIDWDSGHEDIPAQISARAPFDLIVSRRGPTSVIQHLPTLAAADSHFLYAGPRDADLLEEIAAKIESIDWQVTWSAVIQARGFLPTFEEYALYNEFGALPVSRVAFDAVATARGFPIVETKCVVVATPV